MDPIEMADRPLEGGDSYDSDGGTRRHAPPYSAKGVKRPRKTYSPSRDGAEACLDNGPDLDAYFTYHDIDEKQRVQLCRSYASYLAAKARSCATDY